MPEEPYPVPFGDDLPRPRWLNPLEAYGRRPGRVGGTARWASGSFLLACVIRCVAINGRDRMLVMASQAFTAMIPLLIVVSGLASSTALANNLVDRFHLSGDAATSVRTLFTRPPDSTGTLTVVGVILLVYSTLALCRYIQRMYEAAWQLPPLGVRGTVNSFYGMLLLLTQIVLLSWLSGLVADVAAGSVLSLVLRLTIASVLWLQVQYLLLSRRVPRRALVPGSVTAAIGQALVSIYSAIWMPHIIEQNSQRYGIVGVTFALLTWLIIVCAGIVAAAVVSAEWARRRRLALSADGRPANPA